MYEINQLINTLIIIGGVTLIIFITTFTYQYFKLRKEVIE